MGSPACPGPSKGTKGFVFVAGNGKGKPEAAERRAIRSHVMLGKNKRKAINRTSRPWHEGPSALDEELQEQLAVVPRDISGTSERHLDKTVRSRNRGSLSVCSPDSQLRDYMVEYRRGVPRWVLRSADDFAFVSFAEDLDKASKQRLFLWFGTIKDIMHPMEWCFGYDATQTYWFDWLFDDSAYRHCLLYTISLIQDLLVGGRTVACGWTGQLIRHGEIASYHFYKTVQLLNERLSDEKTAVKDSTVAVVMSIAMTAEVFGDVTSARAHVAGLKSMVQLRGGLASFGNNFQLRLKLNLVDLGYSISCGSKPAFFHNITTYDPYFSSDPELSSLRLPPLTDHAASTRQAVLALDPRLYSIYTDLQDFSRLANSMLQSGDRISTAAFHGFMTSVQYRLLYLEFDAKLQPLAELLRMGLLAYLMTFFLRLPGIRLRYAFLSERMRCVVLGFDPDADAGSWEERRLYAWALVVGAWAVLGHDLNEPWLRRRLSYVFDSCLGRPWSDAQARLREVMWIDTLHDLQGMDVMSSYASGPITQDSDS